MYIAQCNCRLHGTKLATGNMYPGTPLKHLDKTTPAGTESFSKGLYGLRCAVLQIERSLVRFQMVSLEFFIDGILPIALWPWGRLSL